jgi:hypothetical protein
MNHIATDAELIAGIAASDDFTAVTDSAHLAELLGMDEDTATDILRAMLARKTQFGDLYISSAQIANRPDFDGFTYPQVQEAMRELITTGEVERYDHYGTLGIWAKR